jgi:hypothetical protein
MAETTHSIPLYLAEGRDSDTFAPRYNADCMGATIKMTRGGEQLTVTFPNKLVEAGQPKSNTSLGPAYQWAVVDKDGKHDLVNVGRTREGVLMGSKIRQSDKKFCGQRKHAPNGENKFLAKLKVDGELAERTLAFTFADRFVKDRTLNPVTAGHHVQSMCKKLMAVPSSDEDSDGNPASMFDCSDEEEEEEEDGNASFMDGSGSDVEGINLLETSGEEEESQEADSEDEEFNTPHPKDVRALSKSNGVMSGKLEDRSRAKVLAISKYQSRPLPDVKAPKGLKAPKAPKAPKTSSGTKRARPDGTSRVPAAARPRGGREVIKERPSKVSKPTPARAPALAPTPVLTQDASIDSAAFVERVDSYVKSVRDGVDAGNAEARALWKVITTPTESAFDAAVLYPIACNLMHHGLLGAATPAPTPTPVFKAPWM